MNFIKKHWSNILFFGFIIFIFTPAGLPVRALLIKGVSYITSRVENMEIKAKDRIKLSDYNWQLIDINGNQTNLQDYQGKVILINNWATWCPPCVAELPSLHTLYKKYKDKVVFIFVANDKPDRVNVFLKKNNLMDLPVYFMQSNTPNQLQSSTIPATFIINKKGEIIVIKKGAADWNSNQVHRILEKNL